MPWRALLIGARRKHWQLLDDIVICQDVIPQSSGEPRSRARSDARFAYRQPRRSDAGEHERAGMSPTATRGRALQIIVRSSALRQMSRQPRSQDLCPSRAGSSAYRSLQLSIHPVAGQIGSTSDRHAGLESRRGNVPLLICAWVALVVGGEPMSRSDGSSSPRRAGAFARSAYEDVACQGPAIDFQLVAGAEQTRSRWPCRSIRMNERPQGFSSGSSRQRTGTRLIDADNNLGIARGIERPGRCQCLG